MLKKINVFLILLLLLFSISVVSATDISEDSLSSDMVLEDTLETSSVEDISYSSSSESDVILTEASDDVLSASQYTITNSNYNNYFDDNGVAKSNINNGDTIILDGSFSNVNMIFNKTVHISGSDSNSMKNSMVTILSGASGSTISNLKIANSNDLTYGIFINGATYCTIKGCIINNEGKSSYDICLGNQANYNNVTGNKLTTSGVTYGHGTRSTPPLLISGSDNNYIANNYLEVDDANAIYLSQYAGGPLTGGDSYYNTIYNNTIKYNVVPTSWSYGIQIMGGSNTVKSNTIIGAYRGVSASGSGNIITYNKIINITGADYDHKDVETGGDSAIATSANSIVAYNIIENAKIISSGAAISVKDNSVVENNVIMVNKNTPGKAIDADGSNVVVRNNNITTGSGAGVYQRNDVFNLTVVNNRIVCDSGIGVLIEKVSNKRMPANITVSNNDISTNGSVIIDASGVNKASSFVIESNVASGVGKIIIDPSGSIDASKPSYKFDGKAIYITPDNIADYVNSGGTLNSNVSDGDILEFSGDFSNVILLVNKQVKITGNDANLYNSSIKVITSGVWIEGLVIKNDKANRANAWGIFVNNVAGAVITNNNIDVTDPNAAYAIYVLNSNNVEVKKNTLSSDGNYLTFTLLVYGSEDCVFEDNMIYTTGTGFVHQFESERCIDGQDVCLDGQEVCLDGQDVCLDGQEACFDGNEFCLDGGHVVPEIYRTYGILVLYSSGNNVSNNKVYASSKLDKEYPTTGNGSSTNSIVGIDIYYNSHNNLVSNNYVNVQGNDNYVYGVGVLGYYTGHSAPEGKGASDNKFIENIIVLEGSYFTEGIVIGSDSVNTLVDSNSVELKSKVAYGVNLELSQKTTIVNNNFTLNSNIGYGIEAISSNNNIIRNNNFDATGNDVYGILISNSKSNDITNNVIAAKGDGGNISFKNLDAIGSGNAGISIKGNSTGNKVDDNSIVSNIGSAIEIDEKATGNTVSNNYLRSQIGSGNAAVNNTNSENNVVDNYGLIPEGEFEETIVKYLGTTDLTVVFTNVDDGVVEFYYNGKKIGQANVVDKKATISYTFNDASGYGNKIVSARLIKDNYKSDELIEGNIYVDKGDVLLTVTDVSIYKGSTGIITVKVVDKYTNAPVKGVDVSCYYGNVERLGSAVTDANGIAKVKTVVLNYAAGKYTFRAFVDDENFNYVESKATLTMLKNYVKITINSKVYNGGILATVKDSAGAVLANKQVTIKVDKTPYTVRTNAAGQVVLPKVAAGTHTIVVSYYNSQNSDKVHEGASASSTAKISVLSIITGNKNFSVYYGNTVVYKVRILTSAGKAIGANKIVTFKVQNKAYKVKTDKNGYASLSVKLAAGTYTATASYGGYTVSNKITFKPTVIAKDLTKKKSSVTKYTVKVVDKKGKAVKAKVVVFKIKGKTYRVKTSASGYATATIKLALKVGKYPISVSYGGCTVSKKIIVKR